MPPVRSTDLKSPKDKGNGSTGKTAPTPKVSKHYQFADADFSLFSSDGVEFKVHGYQLVASSSVFRTMLSLAPARDTQRAELRLTDDTEAQHTLKIVLDLFYGVQLKNPTACINKCVNVYDFLVKYDCPAALQTWRLAVRSWSATGEGNGLTVFVVAARMGDTESCAQALLHSGNDSWSDSETNDKDDKARVDIQPDTCVYPSKLRNVSASSRLFDPHGMNIRTYLLIPPVYFLAMTRAFGNIADFHGDFCDMNLDDVYGEFKAIMASIPPKANQKSEADDMPEMKAGEEKP